LKIFFAIKNLSNSVGGAERVFCRITSALVEKGFDIYVITFDKKGSNSFYPIDPRVKRINISIGDSSSKSNIIEFFRRIHFLKSYITNNKPDLIVGFMHSIYIPLAFALLNKSIPIIASEHITIDHYKSRPIQFLLLLISSFRINKFTVLSKSIKRKYPLIISNKMKIIANPISIENQKRLQLTSKNRKTILNIGRLDPQKDQITLIKAFSKICNQFQDWELRIIGSGFLKKRLEDSIKELDLNNRILIKSVTNQIEKEYINADIFVISSHYESYGLVTAEAMTYGLPCVGFANCPGTNELIIHKKTGLLVDGSQNRSESLANGLQNIMSDSELRGFLGANGKKEIQRTFSEKEIINEWAELFYSIVEDKG